MTMTRISTARTRSSSMVARSRACESVVHLPGSLAWEDSSVMTSTRRIEAIRPTIRNGSHTRVPDRNDTRTVCRISTTMSTKSSRSIATTSASI